MARGDLPEVHGHCVGASPTPLCTITTGRTRAGDPIWWIGGEVAERGAHLTPAEAIAHAQREVSRCLAWVDLDGVRWTSWFVDRAESATPGGKRPVGPVLREAAPGLFACWPTKLAYAPEVGDVALAEVARRAGSPGGAAAQRALDDAVEAAGCPRPQVAPYPWDAEGLAWT